MFKSIGWLGLALAFGLLAPSLVRAQAVYVLDGGRPGHISTIDIARHNLIFGTLPAGKAPADIVVSPDGARLYISNSGDGTVSVINPSTGETVATIPVGPLPLGLVLSPDGSTLLVAHSLLFDITVVSTASNTVVSNQLVPNVIDGPMVYSLDGAKVYAPIPLTGKVAVLDGSTGALLHTITVHSLPRGIALSPDGTTLFVANSLSNNISVIDTSTDTVTTTFSINTSVGRGPTALAIAPDGSKLYVATTSDGVEVFDATTHAYLTDVPTPPLSGAFSLAITKDGAKVYVTSLLPRAPVTVINTADDTTTTVNSATFSTPTAIAFDQLPPLVPSLGDWSLAALAAAMAGVGAWMVRDRRRSAT